MINVVKYTIQEQRFFFYFQNRLSQSIVRTIFDNKYVEYNFSGMIGHTDNMIKQAEAKQFMQQKNNEYEC